MKDTVRIGSCSGFWGDSLDGARQLVEDGHIDYLVGDYLAEVTMSLLVRAKAMDSEAGYAPDFVEALRPVLPLIAERNIRVVVNAGGINPHGCAKALSKAVEEAGVALRIAVVEGDDLMPQLDRIRASAPREMFNGAEFPAKPLSMNAYLGARPIAEALQAGAQVVITGRCVDSALVLGPLMYEFGWSDTDYDQLSGGSLAGHLLECGAQGTGGLFTDWEQVPAWEDMGYPIAECHRDGSMIITKPENTGGLVTPASVCEQMLYEIGDPSAYLMPDVVCDWTQVQFEQVEKHRVRVWGARGRPPTSTYKVSATYGDGYRSFATLMIGGFDAAAKARRQGEAIVARARRLMIRQGHGDFTETSVEVLGSEESYGASARASQSREVVLKIGVRHPRKDALVIFSRELSSCGTAMAQGTTGFVAGRPGISPVVRLYSFLADKRDVVPVVQLEDQRIPVVANAATGDSAGTAAVESSANPAKPPSPLQPGIPVPLRALAWARSGDKGNHSNIGLIARHPEYVAVLRDQVSPRRVAEYFAHYVQGEVLRWELPGSCAFNFLLKDALGGGGMASLRMDALGKAFGQMLLDLPVVLPDSVQQRVVVAST